jgi:hypothetical protein
VTKAEQLQRRQEWEERLAAYHASGQSARAWCEANGAKLHQLRYRLERERTNSAGEPASTVWLKATVAADSMLRVRIGNAVIEVGRGFDPDLLAAVARSLVGAC